MSGEPTLDHILFVDHLSMRFGGIVAVNDLSFSAEPRKMPSSLRGKCSELDMCQSTSLPLPRARGCMFLK